MQAEEGMHAACGHWPHDTCGQPKVAAPAAASQAKLAAVQRFKPMAGWGRGVLIRTRMHSKCLEQRCTFMPASTMFLPWGDQWMLLAARCGLVILGAVDLTAGLDVLRRSRRK